MNNNPINDSIKSRKFWDTLKNNAWYAEIKQN